MAANNGGKVDDIIQLFLVTLWIKLYMNTSCCFKNVVAHRHTLIPPDKSIRCRNWVLNCKTKRLCALIGVKKRKGAVTTKTLLQEPSYLPRCAHLLETKDIIEQRHAQCCQLAQCGALLQHQTMDHGRTYCLHALVAKLGVGCHPSKANELLSMHLSHF